MNYNQKKRFNKIYSDPLYLLDTEMTEDYYGFKISGSTSNIYSITIDTNWRTISCDCPDMKTLATKQNIVCKHCCFILHRVLNAFDNNPVPDFYRSLILSREDLDKIKSGFEGLSYRSDIINDDLSELYQKLLMEDSTKTTGENAYQQKKPISDENICAICFDGFNEGRENLECPACHNLVHKTCMEKWISLGKISCVYCRSNIWKNYKTAQNDQEDYKNLLGC